MHTNKQRYNSHSPICGIPLILFKRNKSQEMQLRETQYSHLKKSMQLHLSKFYTYQANLKRIRKIEDSPEHAVLEK